MPMGKIHFNEAVVEYMVAKKATGFSEKSLCCYHDTYKKTEKFLSENPFLDEIPSIQFQKLLIEYSYLKKKTRRNMCVALSSLYEYHKTQGNADVNVLKKFKWPTPDSEMPEPLSIDQVERILHIISETAVTDPASQRKHTIVPKHTHRNIAIVLLLLDTGIRASEFCNLQIQDISASTIKVFGKGSIERVIPISPMTHHAILHYWLIERGGLPESGHVFVNYHGKPMTQMALGSVLRNLGRRANVHLNPHRFRHTFAISFLRNRGNIYVLQKILGHSTLDMVKHYLKISEADITTSHKASTPLNRLKFDPLSEL